MLSKFEESTLSGIHRGVILLGCSSSPFGQPGEDQFPTAEISQTDRSTGGILSVAVQACLCEHVCVSLEALQYLSWPPTSISLVYSPAATLASSLFPKYNSNGAPTQLLHCFSCLDYSLSR